MTNEHTQAKSGCCKECDASRKSYPVGVCAYAHDCPCHKAPEQAKDWFGKWMETKAAYPKLFDKLTIELVEEIFAQLLAERDAETEKRVRAEIDKGVKKIDWLQLDEDGHTILISKAAALKVIRGNEPTV